MHLKSASPACSASDVPILLLLFNRPDTTNTLINLIRALEPRNLYIAMDGPRTNNSNDIHKCNSVLNIIKKTDWRHSPKTLINESNLGCKKSVSAAISWFFSNVPYGIILEDDCIPHISFFEYCHTLLEYFENDMRVGMISGNNLINSPFQRLRNNCRRESYFLSYGGIWGWASWSNRWNNFNPSPSLVDLQNAKNDIQNFIGDTQLSYAIIEMIHNHIIINSDSWAIPWLYSRLRNSQYTINPKHNLVANIGFGNDATHTKYKSSKIYCKTHKAQLPLVHPSTFQPDYNYIRSQYLAHRGSSLKYRLKSFFAKLKCHEM